MIEEDHFHAAALQLVQQQDLIGILPRKSIGAMNVQTIDGAGRRHVTQSFQRGSNQCCSTVALIEKTHLRFQRQTVGGDPPLKSIHLAVDGRRFCLLLRRNPGVDRRNRTWDTCSCLNPPCPSRLPLDKAWYVVLPGETGQSPNDRHQSFVGRSQNLPGQPRAFKPPLHLGRPTVWGRGAIHRRNLLYGQELHDGPSRDLTSARSPGHTWAEAGLAAR